MLIAHLPAGYLLSHAPKIQHLGLAPFILAGSVLPDFDMIWFHLVDHRQIHHHNYLTHRPFVWMTVLFFGLLWWGRGRHLLTGLGLGGLLHVTLDSMAGAIDWGWPFFTLRITFVEILARFDWWVWSFVTNPSFAVEVGICLIAGVVFTRQRFSNKAPR